MSKATVPEIKTPADLLAYIREFGTAQVVALNGLLDKVPENLKAEYIAMRDRMNTLLAGLKPLDQVPAAQDASFALNSFARTLNDIFEYADIFRTRLEGIAKDLQGKQTSLNGFEEQVKNGDLVSKDKVELAKTSAVDEAVKPFKAEIAALRKNSIALCGLPDAPDSVLAADAAAFDTALTQAKKNLGVLTGKGLALKSGTAAGKGDAFIRKSVWLGETAFNGEAAILAELAPGLKLNLGASGDPMVGAPGGAKKENDPAATGTPKFVCA